MRPDMFFVEQKVSCGWNADRTRAVSMMDMKMNIHRMDVQNQQTSSMLDIKRPTPSLLNIMGRTSSKKSFNQSSTAGVSHGKYRYGKEKDKSLICLSSSFTSCLQLYLFSFQKFEGNHIQKLFLSWNYQLPDKFWVLCWLYKVWM